MNLRETSVVVECNDCVLLLLYQRDGVLYKSRLHKQINIADIGVGEGRTLHAYIGVEVNVQTRVVVDLEYPGFEVPVDEQVEPQNLEWFACDFHLVREGCDLIFDERRVNLHGFGARVDDAVLHFFNVDTFLLQGPV